MAPTAESGVLQSLEAEAQSRSGLLLAADPADQSGIALDEATVSPSSLSGVGAGPDLETASVPAQPAVAAQSAPGTGSGAGLSALGPMSTGAADAAPSVGVLPELTQPAGGPVTAAALIGPVVAVEPAVLPQMKGVALLRQLAVQPRSELARFFVGNADSVRSLLAAPPSAGAVTAWWQSVPPAWKHTISRSAPELVGNLNGIPFPERSAANQSLLTESLVHLESQLDADLGRAELGETLRRVEALKDIRGALGDGNSEPQRYLLSLDLDREPTAAIAVGDPQQADYVSFLIPGMFFNTGSQISEWTDTAARLYEEQVSWLELLGAKGNEAGDTIATIAWVGYQTPHLLNVGSLDLAREGRDSLTGMVEGLQSSRGADQPFLSILAHSYGSTAALMALEENDFTVDALAVIGSPGSAAQSVDELNVRNGNVFVGEAAWDPIPNSSYFGSDPGAESYGAKRMDVGGGLDVIREEVLAASIGHNEYFGPGTESLRNLALLAIDQGDLVTDGTERDQERTVASVGR
ncbi:alpha/beta hydrolase [Lysobacter korlensis]|uniref:Alpha/beta hydrolase n=1 Tax=Lysobacter korlensis TaxID=553636 RepID=A0ABV6RNL1_9GAMM